MEPSVVHCGKNVELDKQFESDWGLYDPEQHLNNAISLPTPLNNNLKTSQDLVEEFFG